MNIFGKLAIAAAAVCVLCAAPHAQTTRTLVAVSSVAYDTGAADLGMAVTANSAEDIFVTGTSVSQYISLKYNKNLVPGQIGTYSGLSGSEARGISVDGLNNIIVAGVMATAGFPDYLTLKYSPNFVSVLSSAVFDGGNIDAVRAVGIDSSNNIFVTGYSNDGASENFYTIKYSASLSTLAVRAYDPVGLKDNANALVIDHANNVIVAGESTDSGGNRQYSVVKYDNNLSTSTYTALFGSGAGYIYTAKGVAIDSQDNVIVTGWQSDGTANWNYCTVKYDRFLNFVSSASYESGGSDKANGVAVDSQDNIIVTGFTGAAVSANFFTIKYDKNFLVISSSAYDGGNKDEANAVKVDVRDNVVIAGTSNNGSSDNYFMIKYNASPQITGVSNLYIGETVTVNITGKGFLADSSVSFANPGISTVAFMGLGEGVISFSVAVSTGVAVGVTTVTVTNANGESATNGTLANVSLRYLVTPGSGVTIKVQTTAGEDQVIFPAGAFPSLVTEEVTVSPAPVNDSRQVSAGITLSANISSYTLVDITIMLRYLEADLAGSSENLLALAWYNAATSEWIGVTSAVNVADNSVTGATRIFAASPSSVKFAVIRPLQSGPGSGGGSSPGGRVYPNPYKPGSGGYLDNPPEGEGIIFSGFTAGEQVTLKILNVAGELVFSKTVAANATGKYLWDTKNTQGVKTVSGVYIYLMKGTGSGKLVKGKFAIIR